MKRILPLLILFLCLTNITIAQVQTNCKKICIVDKVVYDTAYLGVQFGSPCDKENKTDKGVIILKVIDGTAAADNNLQDYDIVLAVNGLEVNRRGDAINAIKAYNPFDTVRFTINREGKTIYKTIVLGAKNTTIIQEEICCEDATAVLSKDNITIFPNPAVNQLNVSFKQVVQGEYDFAIYMTNGVLVKEYKKRFTEGVLNEDINVDKLEEGVYVLKISKNNATYSNLFVVKRN
ncbi:PDZ domain-containing protein [Olleya aquimaris]|uniref:Putative secreted protein (Por secretion system target) n=1 Tax=Olleya aquimaris TaxID=639310 RepID=A0A327RQB1_9FLAO|nr:PDZ domain-containing protein [Olleya aquimaris]RAJ18152.1 putative secreted protein (Por secretion system target) [Olleya aquimaris]